MLSDKKWNEVLKDVDSTISKLEETLNSWDNSQKPSEMLDEALKLRILKRRLEQWRAEEKPDREKALRKLMSICGGEDEA